MTITGIWIDTKYKTASTIAIEDKLEKYYEILNCDTIDIVGRSIAGSPKEYNIVCDDEALLKSDPIPSALDKDGNVALVGSLFITGGTDGDGNLTSLSANDVAEISKAIKIGRYDGEEIPVLYWVE